MGFTVWRHFNPRGALWHTAVHTYNAFFMKLPVSSFSSLLTANSINLVVACDGLLHNTNCPCWLLWLQRCFLNNSWFVLLCNKLTTKHNCNFTSQMMFDITRAHGTIILMQNARVHQSIHFLQKVSKLAYCVFSLWYGTVGI